MKEQLVESTKQIYDGVNACTSITVHETDNTRLGADAQAHANLQSSGNVRQASWHIQVDDVEAVRSYPDEAQCWHAGTREGCETSIAVEICVNADGDYDKAFTRAAATVAELRQKHNLPRSAVVQHSHWTGKDCPSRMRLAGRWGEFLDLTNPTQKEHTMTKFSSPLPVGTYRTDAFDGLGHGREHMGTDWAGPNVGDKTPVYAVADGIVEAAGGGNFLPGHSGNKVIIDHGILKDANGADRIRTNYGHLSRIDVEDGQRVTAGDQIGITGDTGNVTGVHLHFGVRQNGTGFRSYFDPEAWLKGKGITVGKTAPLTGGNVKPVGTVKPKPKPKPKPKLQHGWTRSQVNNIVRAMNRMGLDAGEPDGDYGPMLTAAVQSFQKHHDLVEDGVYGKKTQAVWFLNRKIQQALKDQGYTKQVVDGWLGAQTEANVRDFQKRTGLKRDGIAGPATQKRLGL